jgi:tRNA 2-thiouridine synthesizing protein A
MTDETTLDLRGLKCPLPALFAKRALVRSRPSDPITVLSDDPLASLDIPHMCRQEGFTVVSVERDGDLSRMVLSREAPRG